MLFVWASSSLGPRDHKRAHNCTLCSDYLTHKREHTMSDDSLEIPCHIAPDDFLSIHRDHSQLLRLRVTESGDDNVAEVMMDVHALKALRDHLTEAISDMDRRLALIVWHG